MNNAESVRQFQPRVLALATLGKRISFLEDATLKECVGKNCACSHGNHPFPDKLEGVANNLLGHFEPRVSKQTLG